MDFAAEAKGGLRAAREFADRPAKIRRAMALGTQSLDMGERRLYRTPSKAYIWL
jgi:hypothetical protein